MGYIGFSHRYSTDRGKSSKIGDLQRLCFYDLLMKLMFTSSPDYDDSSCLPAAGEANAEITVLEQLLF